MRCEGPWPWFVIHTVDIYHDIEPTELVRGKLRSYVLYLNRVTHWGLHAQLSLSLPPRTALGL